MSKKLTRKGLALTVALSFGLTGLTSIAPAYAAAGDVISVAPTSGSNWGSYDTDSFSVTATIDNDVVELGANSKLGLNIDNADSLDVDFKLSDGFTTDPADFEDNGVGIDDYCWYSIQGRFTDDDENVSEQTIWGELNVGPGSTDAECTVNAGEAALFTADFSTGSYTHLTLDLEGVSADFDSSGNAFVDAEFLTSNGTDNAQLGITAWLDSDADNKFESTDKYPSTTETINFYDPTNVSLTPRIERFVATSSANYFNGVVANRKIGVSVAFAPALNLDQLTTTALTFNVGRADDAGDEQDDINVLLLNGNSDYDDSSRLYGYVEDDANLALDKVYTVGVYYDGDAATDAATLNTSSGFTLSGQTDLGAAGATAGTDITGFTSVEATDDTNSKLVTNDFTLRAGTKSFTYMATANVERANVPVIARVTATDLATNGSLTVGAKTLDEGQSAIVTGVTNADGEFSVSVASELATSGEDYEVIFYYLSVAGAWTAGNTYTATYAKGVVDSITAVSDVVAGSSVEVKFNVEDQFGAPISVDADGAALYARLYASDTDNLDKYATVSGGKVSFTFANYLAKGESDTLTVKLGTGGANEDSFELLSPAETDTVSLYNPEAASAITVDSELEQEITYDAFITGEADSTDNVAPANGDAFEYAGTVVDADGNGVPGSVVTVSAKGLQFQQDVAGAEYYKDSITVAADAAGGFDLKVWAHKVSSTGITITVTAGGKTATTDLTTTANNNVVADDLLFTWNAPKHPAVNTTYIVTTKVTDLWGNPFDGSSVDFNADGALEINGSSSTVTKTTNAAGVIRVYVRSLEDTDGVASLTATLNEVTAVGATTVILDSSSSTTAGVGDGTAAHLLLDGDDFDNVITADLTVGKDGAAKAGKLAGVLRVTSWNAKGKTVKVYVNGKLKATRVAALSTNLFKVRGLSAGTKTVKVVVGGSTFFNEAVTIK